MSLIWIVNILSVFFLCVFFAGIVIPQILLIAFRRRLFDEPDERKIHQCVVPRLGGMAFKPVVFFSFVLLLAVNVFPSACELLCRRPPLFQRGGMGIYAVFPERHAALCGESEKR